MHELHEISVYVLLEGLAAQVAKCVIVKLPVGPQKRTSSKFRCKAVSFLHLNFPFSKGALLALSVDRVG